MYKAHPKVPRTTRTVIWRDWLTYLILGLALALSTAIVVSVWRGQAEAGNTARSMLFVLLLAVFLLIHRKRHMAVYAQGLRALVEHKVGHRVSNLYRSAPVEELRGGQGGWVEIVFVRTFEDKLYVDTYRDLHDHPCGSHPALVVRDDDGKLHLFRFAGGQPPPSEWLPDTLSAELVDHGVIGPNKFEPVMFKAKETTTQ